MKMNIFKQQDQEEEKVIAKPKKTSKINFKMCSECGLPQNQ